MDSRIYFVAWLSLVERCVRDAEVASSNLVATIWKNWRHWGVLENPVFFYAHGRPNEICQQADGRPAHE